MTCISVFGDHVYEAKSTMILLTDSSSLYASCTPAPIYTCKYYLHAWIPDVALIRDSEDFGLTNARRILDRYRPEVACFNDDVQGTGVITLAAIMAGLHVSGLKLTEMRMVVFGSGTAGIGIADQVRDAIAAESGKSKEDAAKQIW